MDRKQLILEGVMPYKTCSNCQAKVGVRTYLCSCGYSFLLESMNIREAPSKKVVEKPTIVKEGEKDKKGKKKKSWVFVANWKDLKINDVVKASGGPYYLAKSGNVTSMGANGKFRVTNIHDDGLTGYNLEDGTFEFIYCGPECKSKLTDTTKIPHKLRKYISQD